MRDDAGKPIKFDLSRSPAHDPKRLALEAEAREYVEGPECYVWDSIRSHMDTYSAGYLACEAKMRAEIERLREALEQVAVLASDFKHRQVAVSAHFEATKLHSEMVAVAREALRSEARTALAPKKASPNGERKPSE